MGLLSILGKGLKAMVDEATTPESHKIGQNFENYVREYLFTEEFYDLVERTHDYNTNSRDYVESSLKPDFKFRDKLTKKEFYVEAKFRSGGYNGKIVWCNDKQLRRYKEYDKEKPVFLILGMGENSKLPEFLSLIPLKAANYTGLFPSYVEKFEIKIGRVVLSKTLWNM
ncbi:MAG: hypothetical protein NTX03_07700 [Bacteroidetes bacterium]|nr:hypothetical protein [Bacteroidota bacterium]